MATIKAKDASGKSHTVTIGVNQAGKSTAKRMAETRKITPPKNKSSQTRERRPRRS
jgi:hypothetical protein